MAAQPDKSATERDAGAAGAPSVDRPATGRDAGSISDADWRTRDVDDLCDALLTLRTRDEAAAFLRDLCSLHELETLAHRLHAARLLDRGLPYARVAEQVRGSTATVTRVAHWLKHGEGGYRLVLDRLGRR